MPIFGAKSRAKRGCASKLSCGHRIDPAERTGFTEVSGEFAISQWAARIDRYYGGLRQIRNFLTGRCVPASGRPTSPSSRTAVTGIGPYKRISNISQYNAQNRHSPQKAVPVPFTDISPLRTAQRTSIVSRSSVNASLPPPGRPEIVSRISRSVMETDQTVS